jgi:hypothetical protein
MSTAMALPRHKLTVEDYHRMVRTGILTDEDHLELIEGDLIEMAPAGPEHADLVAYIARIMRTQTTFLVREEKPVTLPEHFEPEPDIALVKPRRYRQAHPHPTGVVMIIEVADTSLDKDKGVKVPHLCAIPYPGGLDRRCAGAGGGMLLGFAGRRRAYPLRSFKACRARAHHVRNDPRYQARSR